MTEQRLLSPDDANTLNELLARLTDTPASALTIEQRDATGDWCGFVGEDMELLDLATLAQLLADIDREAPRLSADTRAVCAYWSDVLNRTVDSHKPEGS